MVVYVRLVTVRIGKLHVTHPALADECNDFERAEFIARLGRRLGGAARCS